MVGVSVGEYTTEAWKKQFGTEPIDWEKARREGRVMTLGNPWIKMQEDPEHQETIISDPISGIKIAIKKADPAEWGPPPWENDD